MPTRRPRCRPARPTAATARYGPMSGRPPTRCESSIFLQLEMHGSARPRGGVDYKNRAHVLGKVAQQLETEVAHLSLRLCHFLVEADPIVGNQELHCVPSCGHRDVDLRGPSVGIDIPQRFATDP